MASDLRSLGNALYRENKARRMNDFKGTFTKSSHTGRRTGKHARGARVLKSRAAGACGFVTIGTADLVVAARARVAWICRDGEYTKEVWHCDIPQRLHSRRSRETMWGRTGHFRRGTDVYKHIACHPLLYSPFTRQGATSDTEHSSPSFSMVPWQQLWAPRPPPS